jgi:hypothetical protein
MATHDYIISNASGAAVRADLNNALAAIASNNSSATAPTTTYAYQWWADTGSSPAVMKLRNAANSAWITLFQLDGEWTVVPFENGTAAAPSIYFKDSGTDTGIYSPGADQVAITTGGTGRLFVDSSGRVGIGTASVNTTLEVQNSSTPIIRVGDGTRHMELRGGSTTQNAAIGTNYNGSFDIIQNGNAAVTIDTSKRVLVGTSSSIGGESFQINNGTTANTVGLYNGTSGTAGAGTTINFRTDGGATGATKASISGQNDSTYSYLGRLVFSTSDSAGSLTERFRITSDGTLQSRNVNGSNIVCINNGSSGTALIYFQTTGAELGKIRINGAGVAYDTTSDYRLKENVEPITGAIDRVQALKPWRFNFISHPEVTVDGFLAHEAQEVVPEAVGGAKDEVDADGKPVYQGIDQSKLVPLLTAALQETIAELQALKAEVASLKAA